jgi:hypothetical protein
VRLSHCRIVGSQIVQVRITQAACRFHQFFAFTRARLMFPHRRDELSFLHAGDRRIFFSAIAMAPGSDDPPQVFE